MWLIEKPTQTSCRAPLLATMAPLECPTLLTGEYTPAGYMARYQQSLAREAVAEYVKVAESFGLTPTQLALAWCKSRWFVASTIIGATTMKQLKVGGACIARGRADRALGDEWARGSGLC